MKKKKHTHTHTHKNKVSQAIQSPHTEPFFLLISLLDGYLFANVHVKGIIEFKHLKKKKKAVTLTLIKDS